MTDDELLDKESDYVEVEYGDGSVYVGDYKRTISLSKPFSAEMRHGKGKMTYPDGVIVEGDFKRDSLHGIGKWTLPDGTKYEGEWNDGQKMIKQWRKDNEEQWKKIDDEIKDKSDSKKWIFQDEVFWVIFFIVFASQFFLLRTDIAGGLWGLAGTTTAYTAIIYYVYKFIRSKIS